MDRIAREIVSIARELVAVKSDFTVIKTLQLKREGATRDSIENARRILAAGYDLMSGIFEFNRNNAEWRTTAHFVRPGDRHKAVHVFRGFSFGYGGEGPHGMYDFLDMFGWGPSKAKIMDPSFMADQNDGKIRLIDLT